MNIFVLGGKGFVGSAMVRVAQKRKHSVTAIDLDNYSQLRGRACDLLINANGNSKKFLAEQDPVGEFDASVASVLRCLVDFPCQRYVHLSTIDVYPRVDSPRFNRETAAIDPGQLSRYGLHKFLAEQVVRKYASRWLILRLGGMVGPGLWKNSIFDISHGKPLRVHLESKYQYLFSEDVAKIALRLVRLQPDNDVFNVCGDGCITLAEVASSAGTRVPPYAIDKPRKEHYEVNIAKLRSLLAVPQTRATIRKFIRQQGDTSPGAST
jgi:nucleoside-diphosphate-sugar epimerase